MRDPVRIGGHGLAVHICSALPPVTPGPRLIALPLAKLDHLGARNGIPVRVLNLEGKRDRRRQGQVKYPVGAHVHAGL